MARYFTTYWKQSTCKADYDAEGEPFISTGSNSFKAGKVKPGDILYATTLADGQLILIGRMCVEQVVTRSQAKRLLKRANLWDASHWCLSSASHTTSIRYDRNVPSDIVRSLKFNTTQGLSSVAFDDDARHLVSKQAFRTLRELTPKSAKALDSILADSSVASGLETRSPFSIPMVFFRIGWMHQYRGQTRSDQIKRGGAWVDTHGYGHEIMNFQPFEGRVYGYGQPTGGRINIDRMGANDGKRIENAVVVWISTPPEGGNVVVGWYQNAVVYRDQQAPPPGSNRQHENEPLGYYVTTKSEHAVLLPVDERLFPVPYRRRGGMGQSNIWYADDTSQHGQYRSAILEYMRTRRLPYRQTRRGRGAPRQPDPLKRQRVEKAAIDFVSDHYTTLGYSVESFEQDNVGWDLEAQHEQRLLRIEVKGLSGGELVVELTPNEYDKMNKYYDSYRLAVVTTALDSPQLSIFSFSPDTEQWLSESGRSLAIDKIIAARCRAE